MNNLSLFVLVFFKNKNAYVTESRIARRMEPSVRWLGKSNPIANDAIVDRSVTRQNVAVITTGTISLIKIQIMKTVSS